MNQAFCVFAVFAACIGRATDINQLPKADSAEPPLFQPMTPEVLKSNVRSQSAPAVLSRRQIEQPVNTQTTQQQQPEAVEARRIRQRRKRREREQFRRNSATTHQASHRRAGEAMVARGKGERLCDSKGNRGRGGYSRHGGCWTSDYSQRDAESGWSHWNAHFGKGKGCEGRGGFGTRGGFGKNGWPCSGGGERLIDQGWENYDRYRYATG